MSKRLQIVVDDEDVRRCERCAKEGQPDTVLAPELAFVRADNVPRPSVGDVPITAWR